MLGSNDRWWILGSSLLIVSCQTMPGPAPEEPLVLKGEDLFFNETFSGTAVT